MYSPIVSYRLGSGVSTWVRTSDCRKFRLTSRLPTATITAQAKWLGIRTSGMSRDFRLSGVSAYVGTSDTDSHRKIIYMLVEC